MASELTKVVRQAEETALRKFESRINDLGFKRTRKRLYVRPGDYTVDFVNVHRDGISYGAPISASVSFRLEAGIRVLNDPFDALDLNGPIPNGDTLRKGRYHWRFNAKSGSTFDRCIADMERYVRTVLVPWWAKFQKPPKLLKGRKSPLSKDSKIGLAEDLDGNRRREHIRRSKNLLGLKDV